MKLVVGLGNPGFRYEGTRHNVGFATVDLLAKRHGATWEAAPRGIEAFIARWRAQDVVLAKPLTFMNNSGSAVQALLQFYKIEAPDSLVVFDEAQLETGRLRIRSDGSSGGHNGLKSVIASLGTEQVPRLRIGVGRGDGRRDLANHVLARFEPEEREAIADAIERAADAAETFVTDGPAVAMNRYNRKQESGDGSQEQETEDN
jgi:PTH1 family peptidyl-tRNA hydrolase